jgi:prepilin-type N-terminal cleavage/methylation domain-containing protein
MNAGAILVEYPDSIDHKLHKRKRPWYNFLMRRRLSLDNLGNKNGFTLIELLVVIAIIALLSSVVFASLNSARAKARDAKRKADLNQIYLALQMYFDDHGYLPTTLSYGENNIGGWDYSSQGGFLTFLAGTYLPTVPLDPINIGSGDVFDNNDQYAYGYFCYISDNPNTMTLGARLESTGNVYYRSNRERNFVCNNN